MWCPLLRRKSSGFSSFGSHLEVLLLLSAVAVGASGSVTSKTSGVTGQVATCVVATEIQKTATLEGSISQANPTFELLCQGTNPTAVPVELKKVCKQSDIPSARSDLGAQTPLSECAADTGKQQCDVTTLLFPGAKAVWEAVTQTEANSSTDKKYRLIIAKEDFPLLDQRFFVGCMEKSKPQSSCQVNITVNARASEVSADNVVTCAYGKDSNKAPVAVTLTPEKNSFTLKCGSEGARIPTEKQEYCSGTSIDRCSAKQLTSLIPKAEASWWTESDGQKTVQFTIPTDKFPSSDTVFLVGCKTAEKEKDATSCNVNVTVKSSAVSSFSKDAFSLGGVLSAVVLALSSGLIA
ncbi:srs domain-containing protein [Cystoisospora suis]|uniref:Srs domain-containing protein n=1 Tax=Cystoisospora suis TaxID=483139 RepID=A0A2C6KGT9_9APIC|nr:srs domain-containing protein [Cystoisospora suis]